MPTSPILLSPEEVVRRGKELYETRIRAQVETGNVGKYLVINVDTGDYEMDRDAVAASDRAAARYPDALLFALRVGYPTMGRIGGQVRPTTP